MKRNYFLAGFLSIILSQAAVAQDSTNAKESAFKFSLNYNSNLNYYGRTDSLTSSGLFPMAEVWFTPSFYINAAPIFINNAVQKFEYAGTVATIGYQFNSNDKWLGNLYALKPFYKEASDLAQAALKAQTGASLTYLNPILNITLGGDLKFSGQTDVGATAGVDHTVRLQLDDDKVLVINPSAYTYAGTQRFSRTYEKRNQFLGIPGAREQVTESSSRFNILAYEFSVPVIFATPRLQISATPSYIIPQNLITIPGNPGASERGAETFYFTSGIKVIL